MSIKDMLANLERLQQEISLSDSMSDKEKQENQENEYDEDSQYEDDDLDEYDEDDESVNLYAEFEFLGDLDDGDLETIREKIWSTLDEFEMSEDIRKLFHAGVKEIGQTNQIVLLSVFAAGVVLGRQMTNN